MSTSFRSLLNTVPHNFSKIIFGTDGLKKPQKVYASFQIPSSEDIVAYIKSSVPFTGPLIVITDCCLYSYLHSPIPFTEICRFIVTQKDEKASVSMSNSQGGEDILGSTLFAKNIAGTELMQFVKSIQRQLLKNYSWAVQQRTGEVDKLIEISKKEMRGNRISEERRVLLNTIAEEPTYSDSVICVVAEDLFRTCDLNGYQRFLSGMPNTVSASTKTRLQSPQGLFADALIRDLSDVSLHISQDHLSVMYGNLSTQTHFSDVLYLILAYTCARLGKTEQFTSTIEEIQRCLGQAKAQQIRFFKGRYDNIRMKGVYETIRTGQLPQSEQLDWVDSIGLTPLHYAILLRHEGVIEELLDKKTWKINAPIPAEDEAAALYDYTVLACMVGVSNRRLIFQKTSDIIAAQLRSRKALEKRRWLKARKLDIQNMTAKKLKDTIHAAKKNGFQDKIYDLQEKLQMQQELMMESQMEIDEIDQEISNIDFEIQEITNDALIEAINTAQRLRASTNPFVIFLIRLFSEPDLLPHILDCPSGCKLYTYQNHSFATPEDVSIDLPYCSENMGGHEESSHRRNYSDTTAHEKEKNQANTDATSIQRPYGDSWFSPEAHRNIKKLKEEYHKLAKQYHPDKCNHPLSKRIFQEIVNERAIILENMS